MISQESRGHLVSEESKEKEGWAVRPNGEIHMGPTSVYKMRLY